MSIGENLRRLRMSKSLSQQDLSVKVGVNQSMIAQLERGTKSMTLALANEISKVLNCKIEDFLK